MYNLKETNRNAIRNAELLKQEDIWKTKQTPSDPSSDGLEEDGCINDQYMLFWSGED